jgi:hypothetical protein
MEIRMRPALLLAAALSLAPMLTMAADPAPEIKRDPATAQAVGVVHTLRTIPEACTRLEGQFTGDAAQPYKFDAVQTSPNCQSRAHFVDAAKAKPTTADGWILNDLIRVPSTACPAQLAAVRVWRRPANVAPPKLDGQGRARIYLADSVAKAKAGELARVPMYAASMVMEGKACGG